MQLYKYNHCYKQYNLQELVLHIGCMIYHSLDSFLFLNQNMYSMDIKLHIYCQMFCREENHLYHQYMSNINYHLVLNMFCRHSYTYSRSYFINQYFNQQGNFYSKFYILILEERTRSLYNHILAYMKYKMLAPDYRLSRKDHIQGKDC